MPGHHAVAISNAVLASASRQGFSVTPMQLQKLVYFCHGWNLEVREAPLVSDAFEAWQYGPVHPKIYHEFKHYGSTSIPEGSNFGFRGVPVKAELSVEEGELIDEVIRVYGGLSGPQMSRLTHKTETPWSDVWNGGLGKGDDIPNQRILEEFRRLRQLATENRAAS